MGTESSERTEAGGGALRRMVRRAPPTSPAPDAGGLRQVAPRVVDRVMGLPVRLGEQSETALSRADLARALPEGALVLRLASRDAPGGLAWLGADLFAALVERRLTGGLRPAAPEPRRATPLDAVICTELLQALCDEPGVLGGAVAVGAHLREPDLAVELPDTPHRLTRLDLGLGRDGERGGELGLALPEPPPAEERPAPSGAMRADLRGCRAEIGAALAPVTLTWSRVTALAPGDVLALPEGAIDAVQVQGLGGAAVAVGRLGRLGEHRAVRVRLPLPLVEVEPVYEEALPPSRSGA